MKKLGRIILRLEGGLGNQLFQYAFARMVQFKYGGVIVIDLHTYKNDNNRSMCLNNFKLNSNVDLNNVKLINILIQFFSRIRSKYLYYILSKVFKDKNKKNKVLSFLGVFKQEESIYSNYLFRSLFPVKYISGNWMSEKFFYPVSQVLREELSMITESTEINKKIISKFKNENSVCVHIRRGDYTYSQWTSKLLVCDFKYYEKAINHLCKSLESPAFYVFSNSHNDIQWIKENYKFSVPVSYIDSNLTDTEEFRLMRNCRHFILSNSSFSWWASYLSDYKDKIVIAPSKWNTGVWDVKDIYLPNWHIIEV